MALSSGTRLGSYEVLDAIGSGGMGEVYRARDVSLNRLVALKLLPPAFAQDAERLARFAREARYGLVTEPSERAVRSGDERTAWFRRDPRLASIRDDPRFAQILASVEARRKTGGPR
jgi:serine/threonine protein kinase